MTKASSLGCALAKATVATTRNVPPILCTMLPHLTPAGQSLPNLSAEAAQQRQAAQRGVTYPPLSPRTLRRSSAVPPPRNPPLARARHVTEAGSSSPPPPPPAADTGESGGRRDCSPGPVSAVSWWEVEGRQFREWKNAGDMDARYECDVASEYQPVVIGALAKC